MANINDYLFWRGDLKISPKRPFNNIDGMILSRFSYLHFDKIKLDHYETIGSIAEKMAHFGPKDFRWPDDRRFIEELGRSRRFNKMKVTDFVEERDKSIEKQFSAITIHPSYGELFVSFLGTDETRLGWKESFNMMFLETIPAQEASARYFKQISYKYPWKRIRTGGHSKGGNLAIYAAITAPDIIQRRIIKVYGFDAPGLSQSLLEKDLGMSILPRIHNFIPQDSIVGRLLSHVEQFEVIKSNAENLFQHDNYTWEVDKNDLVKATITKKSNFVNEAITKWMKTASVEQRKLFVEAIFDIFAKGNIENPINAAMSWPKHLPAVFKGYRGISKEEKKIIWNLMSKFREYYLEVKKSDQKKAK